jgi:protein SCO1
VHRRAALALGALGLIGGITASWWALALWPMPAAVPEWLVRARVACFGNSTDGLPNAGGWVLLIGQPAGMVLLLLTGWGADLRDGFVALARGWGGRLVLALATVALLGGARWAAGRVREERGEPFDPRSAPGAAPARIDAAAPPLGLVDQAGDTLRVERYAGRPVVVAFAYGHCEAVCPLIVHDLLAGAARLGETRPELLIVTLDPWRDTPARLPAVAAGWGLPPSAHVLSGSVDQVERVLDEWAVPRSRSVTTGEVAHPTLAYLVGRDGRLAFRLDGRPESLVAAVTALSR